MKPLYEISEKARDLDTYLQEIDGDVSDPAIESKVDSMIADIETETTEAVDQIAALVTSLMAMSKARREEYRRIRELADHDEARASLIKRRLQGWMDQQGLAKVETARFRVSVAKNGGPQPLDIHDPAAVPRVFCRHKPEEWIPDVAALGKALASGREIPGVVPMERGKHLRIK